MRIMFNKMMWPPATHHIDVRYRVLIKLYRVQGQLLNWLTTKFEPQKLSILQTTLNQELLDIGYTTDFIVLTAAPFLSNLICLTLEQLQSDLLRGNSTLGSLCLQGHR
jgi:hypothetical protein